MFHLATDANVLAGLTRLELAISASTVQRFHPTKLQPHVAGMTRLELANQLIENQSAFHFAFIPMLVPAEGFEPTLASF